MNKYLEKYKDNFDNVQGWASPKLFDIVNILDSLEINKSGGIMEIGVHHGKFFILLNQVIEGNVKSYACDVFEDQNLNIDKSGSGSLSIFKDNLTRFDRHKGGNVEIIQGDSTDTSLELVEKIGRGTMRFISIDGGHTAEHTVNDLVIAQKIISNQGVVILDDILNYHWVGVIEGALKYLATAPSLVPFAIGMNKLLLCKLSYQEYYFSAFQKSNLATKKVKLSGYDLVAL